MVQSGDTLGSIAQKYNTTVDELTTLNPGIDPTALHIGQRIRVESLSHRTLASRS